MKLVSDEAQHRSAEVCRVRGSMRDGDDAAIRMAPEIESGEGLRAERAFRIDWGQRDRQPVYLTGLNRFERRNDDLIQVTGRHETDVLTGVVDTEVLARYGE